MEPLPIVVLTAAVASAACWILSLATRDTSWVDRAWSIVPVVYVWIFTGTALAGGEDASRLVLMAVLVTLWGVRLTYNFARKGGYTGMEDYRWAILRGRMKPWQFQLFNLLFIIAYQMTLLVLITLPAEIALQHPAPLNAWDLVFAAIFLALLIGETVADQQQWEFHRRKKQAGGTLAPRLRHRGAVPCQPAPQLLLRAEPVVGALRDRGDGCGRLGCRLPRRRAELDGDRAVPAQHPVPRIDDLHRVDHRGEVFCVRRLPPDDINAHPLAAADPTSRRVRGLTEARVSAPPRRMQRASPARGA
ncbi:DUF1295 domain-containing protein [Microbacterium phyllosphaerae]|uniref:DUF1295 domain-containing protein n=1 Tax=Microbacterium phyllosphaerae TaxID=124798 RepID=UPI003D767A8F